ncbi:hypothetical protein MUY27_11380 [Mucilaginibacter sp. RS28]|uniref:Organic solvent tolerance-like N-terminal domain-containing protein n=1 Tax=Mucilaginibacter straminoryzae TaxID=2932774 RepID=A0A9X1X3L7_9SPHI|nr:LptA/OstA family protein [Mucilaginibacter straminoryzae]MCJ8210311.1 hypothetical protein [Mucilaginibacter straminoryzae]
MLNRLSSVKFPLSAYVLSLAILSLTSFKNSHSAPEFEIGQLKATAKDSSYFDEKQHMIKLYGNASISNGNKTIMADYIEFNGQSKTGKAEGNIKIYSSGDTVSIGNLSIPFSFK